MDIKINSALISVFSKEGLAPIIEKLNELGVTIYSTGGTEAFIKDLGVSVVSVESVTGYPSILGGRVKTLHPKVFGGILNRQDNSSDLEALKIYQIPQIDLVIVDLYPFEKTMMSGANEQDIVEKIDIGGISLIRAAAKNFKDVMCVSSMQDYAEFMDVIVNQKGVTTLTDRKYFSAKAFGISSHYDTAIFNYFNETNETYKISYQKGQQLRYGENPHQEGFFFGDFEEVFDKLHGKKLSYNNLLDVDASINLISEFADEQPTFAVLKHNNACGVATRSTILEAYERALESDYISAFGGVLISNARIDEQTAQKINELFFEVIIAPEYDVSALDILKKKKNRIILRQKKYYFEERLVRSCLNGILVQGRNNVTDSSDSLEVKTKVVPNSEEIEDLIFASKICKHTKSNTIVLVKQKQLLGGGTGQTSRIDALRHAIEKAKSFDLSIQNAVMASDAFFPFPDCVTIASENGISSVIQPGGSIKDQLSIDACNEKKISMVFTGIRHFKH